MKKNLFSVSGVVLLVGLLSYFVVKISGPEMGLSAGLGDWIIRLSGVVMLVGLAMAGFGLGKKLSVKK